MLNDALSQTNGTYARAVLLGTQALSGADLRGKARQYGGWYARQRSRAVGIARECGAHIHRGAHGRLELAWDAVPEGAVLGSCALGECWNY